MGNRKGFNSRIRKWKRNNPLKDIEVVQILRINGRAIGKKKKRLHGVISTGGALTPRYVAFYLVCNKHLIQNWHHRRWDIFNCICKELPSYNIEEVEEAWLEFFIQDQQFIEKLFEERNSRQSEYVKIGDQLKLESEGLINHFAKSPLPVKYAFLYYLVKTAYNMNYAEIQTDVEKNVPLEAKSWVDRVLSENKTED